MVVIRLWPFILTVFILVALPFAAVGQERETKADKPKKQGMLFWKINRYDRQDRYHGRWKVYLGDERTVIRNGRFRHGAEVGKWKYYYPSGTRYMVEKYNRRNNIIEVQKFHENGNLARQGTARIIRSTFKDHYYWFGDWQVYDAQGNYSYTETYQSGNLVGSTKGK
ncbi:toxin-antitoxin system YwqK family antitoxin [Pontibacter flavimaris]|uniref:Toxin-antitoxin system YwqK family antitoxin n=1 Tax=Pontibacter flavimaris TaxID=1797110 RepID=A0A1Q5PH01_9BACT|nr:hypothetical protein [Pontibacter flavimaris]OKL41510.1 hypothetical protein A3841_10695 [Pontibacter flavimaris]